MIDMKERKELIEAELRDLEKEAHTLLGRIETARKDLIFVETYDDLVKFAETHVLEEGLKIIQFS